MKKIVSLMAVVLVVMMAAAMFTACGDNNGGSASYDGTYNLVEMSMGDTTINADLLKSTGQSMTLTINGTKASLKGSDDSMNQELEFDPANKTFSAGGESVPATFEGNKVTLEESGTKMVFEKQ